MANNIVSVKSFSQSKLLPFICLCSCKMEHYSNQTGLTTVLLENYFLWTFKSSFHICTVMFLLLCLNYLTVGKWVRKACAYFLFSASTLNVRLSSKASLTEEDLKLKKTLMSKIKRSVYLLLHHSLTTTVMTPIVLYYLRYWMSHSFGCDNLEYHNNGWRNAIFTLNYDLIYYSGSFKFSLEILAYLCYLYQLAYYVHALMTDLFSSKERKKDFLVMVVHHIVAFTLIVIACYYDELRRPGLVILFLHDSTDVLLYVSKILAYIGASRSSKLSFFLFSVTFILVRLGFFPVNLILYERLWGYVSPGRNLTTYALVQLELWPKVAHYLLWLLICCHLFWTVIILNMCVDVYLRGNDLEDFRETKPQSEQPPSETKKKTM